MIMLPVMDATRSGGDLENLGGIGKYCKDVCHDGCVFSAEKTAAKIFIKANFIRIRINMKDLKDMTLEELWQIFPIELKSHNDDYPLWYSEKAEEIGQIIGKDIFSINHIGSTAVNIIAKPIIDILVEIKDGADMNNVAEKLQANGWQVMNRGRERISLNQGYTTDGYLEKVYHLHIRKLGYNDEIYFKEYLIANPVVADEYVALKITLAKKYRNNRDAYTEAKSEFVEKYTNIAKSEFSK